VRLWNVTTGEQLCELSVHNACVNTIAFDSLGKRLYTGDGDGIIKELSCDVKHRRRQSQHGSVELAKVKDVSLRLLRSGAELAGEPIAHMKVVHFT
jgi:WD40 repeat protein